MAVVRWDRERATGPVDPLAVDDLAGHVLVLDGVGAVDDPALGWVRRAPCVVIGWGVAGRPSAAVDVVVGPADGDLVGRLVERALANPLAARVLVDVLRTVPGLDVAGGLTLESLAYSTLLAGPEFEAWHAARPSRSPRRFPDPPVRLEREGPTLRVTLARPENRNAFSAAMRDALVEALSMVELDPSVDQVVLRGDGPVFSSGGDLTEFGTTPDVAVAHDVRSRRSVGALLAGLRARTTVEVRGACVGAGVELAAFGAHVVADPGATFQLPEVAMGLIPGAGGTVSVTRRIGRQATTRFALLGEPIDAGEALRLGLVDEVRDSA